MNQSDKILSALTQSTTPLYVYLKECFDYIKKYKYDMNTLENSNDE